MKTRQKKWRKPAYVTIEEIAALLRDHGYEVLGPGSDEGQWELLARHMSAPRGAPLLSVPLLETTDGELFGERSTVEAVIPSRREQRMLPGLGREAPLIGPMIPLEEAFRRIDQSGAQGHVGADQDTGEWWIRISRCVSGPDGNIRCFTLGDLPVKYLEDGRPGVEEEALEAILANQVMGEAQLPQGAE
jgi:hypothetical protein